MGWWLGNRHSWNGEKTETAPLHFRASRYDTPVRQHQRLWIALVVAVSVISASCGSHDTKTNARLATQACQSFLAATVTTGGILERERPAPEPRPIPEARVGAQRLEGIWGQQASDNAIKKASPAVTGAYDPSSVTQARFKRAQAAMNDVGGLCAPFGVTFPQIGT